MKDHAAVDQAVLEVEAEFRAIRGDAAPAAFEELAALGGQDDLAGRGQDGFLREHALDQVHVFEMSGVPNIGAGS